MRIARVALAGGTEFAVSVDGEKWIPFSALSLEASETASAIVRTQELLGGVSNGKNGLLPSQTRFQCPIVRPSKILAIGLNYLDHIRETHWSEPEHPIVFSKFPSSLSGPRDPIVLDSNLTVEGDYEVELAVIIGRRARGVSEAEALSFVYGYAVANDVSARDGQMSDGQFDRSKGFDTFCPIGPWITAADDIDDPQALTIRSFVNGELRQDSSTSQMLFSVAELIAYISRGTTLLPGDVILTGTPHGVGFAMQPPNYLKPGDVVTCEIEGLGGLENEVVGPEVAASRR